MKTIASLGILLLTLASSHGAVLVSGFGTTNGNLVGASSPQGGTWAEVPTSYTGPNLVLTNGVLAIDNSNGQDASIGFANYTSGSLYYAVTLTVTDANAGQFIAGFATDGAAGTNAGRLFVQESGAGFILGTSRLTTGVYGSTVLSLNTAYRVVIRYDLGVSPQARIYVNPTDLSNEGANSIYVQTTGSGAGLSSIAAFAFFQNASAGPDAFLSNLNVATTFAEAAAVPEPSSLALAAIGAFGLAMLRRRQVLA